jgi:hypothetical protein
MTTIVKLVGHILDVTWDETHSSFTLRGPANSLSLSEWLLHAMDKPAGWQPTMQESENPSSREYHLQKGNYPMDDRTPVARVYYLRNAPALSSIEILTTVRAVGEIQEVADYDGLRMMVFRGTATAVDLGEWMIRKLDVPAGGEAFAHQNESTDGNVFKLPGTQPDGTEDMIRVFYLDPAIGTQAFNDITGKIRATSKTLKVFGTTSPPTITVRGNSALLAQARQIIEAGSH